MQPGINGAIDDIYAQLSNDGSTLLYGTFIGGDNEQNPSGGNPAIVVDGNGDINFLTETDAFNAPTTPGAYSDQPAGKSDLYIVKFDGADDGRSIKAATYFGTLEREILETHDLAVDDEGNFIVVGETAGATLETSRKSFQSDFSGGGTDGFIAKISADGTELITATYFGGNGRDNVEGVILKSDGIYVTGFSESSDLAVTDGSTFSGVRDAFVARFSTDLRSADYVSYVGGSEIDAGRAIAVSDEGQITLGGYTRSTDYPLLNPADGTFWGPANSMLTSFTISSGDANSGGGGKGRAKNASTDAETESNQVSTFAYTQDAGHVDNRDYSEIASEKSSGHAANGDGGLSDWLIGEGQGRVSFHQHLAAAPWILTFIWSSPMMMATAFTHSSWMTSGLHRPWFQQVAGLKQLA